MNYSKRQFEILNKSIELISERGIQNLTIKNLSHKIGISEPAIYRHFENKFEILKAILTLFKTAIESNFNLINDFEISAIDKIEKIFDDHIIKFSSNHHYAAVIFSEDLFKNEHRLSDLIENIMMLNIENTKKIIIDGQKNGEIRDDIKPKELSTIILGSLRLLVKEWAQNGFKSDLIKDGNSLKNSIIKIIKNKSNN